MASPGGTDLSLPESALRITPQIAMMISIRLCRFVRSMRGSSNTPMYAPNPAVESAAMAFLTNRMALFCLSLLLMRLPCGMATQLDREMAEH